MCDVWCFSPHNRSEWTHRLSPIFHVSHTHTQLRAKTCWRHSYIIPTPSTDWIWISHRCDMMYIFNHSSSYMWRRWHCVDLFVVLYFCFSTFCVSMARKLCGEMVLARAERLIYLRCRLFLWFCSTCLRVPVSRFRTSYTLFAHLSQALSS